MAAYSTDIKQSCTLLYGATRSTVRTGKSQDTLLLDSHEGNRTIFHNLQPRVLKFVKYYAFNGGNLSFTKKKR